MPTTYSDQFYTFDPASPPPFGTSVSFSSLDLVDQDDDDDIESAGGDTVNGSDVTASWPGDTITINVSGVGNVTYTGITFYTADGSRYFTPTDGQVLQNGTFVSSTFVDTQGPLDINDLGPPCFVVGTRIETAKGLVAVENIKAGDWVETLDHGMQQVRWAGQRTVPGTGDFAPIRIANGALGNVRDLLVSPQHRMLISGWRAELYCGGDQILAAAKHLCNQDKIHVRPQPEVTYVHLLFGRHEIIFAEGIPSESFDPSGEMIQEDRQLRAELESLFPEIMQSKICSQTARPVVHGYEASVLFA